MPPNVQEQIRIFLEQILDPRMQKDAEKSLKLIEEGQPEFILDLIKLIGSSDTTNDIRLVGAVYLKNQIKSYWTDETSTKISAIELRNCIKKMLIDLLAAPSLQVNVQMILSDVISHISFYDFPNLWPELLPSLINNLSMDNLNISNTILGCLNAIFKKYRHEVRSDELFLEIKLVLQVFAPILAQLFKAYDSQWDLFVMKTNDQQRKSEAESILFGLGLLNRIFFSLNFQDLPEYFEDNMKVFVMYFQKYLQTSSTFPPSIISLLATGGEDEPSPIEKLRRAIIINLNLYASKYSEDFPFVDSFVPLVWGVISETSQMTKFDPLVGVSMGFLESVAKQYCNKKLFEDPNVLKELVDKVIVSNILLRDCDVELFEDDPIEWLKRDVEGTSHEGSRRSSASSLIRGLSTFHQDNLIPLLIEHVTKFMQINTEVSQCWKFKDASIFLFTAIAGSSTSSRSTFTHLNPLVKDKLDHFYSDYVFIDLENSKNKNSLVVVDCITFLTTFRGHLSQSLVLKSLSMIISLLSNSNEGVRNSCYISLDKLLVVSNDRPMLLDQTNIAPFLQQTIPILIRNLNSLLSSGNYQKLVSNEFLLKAILRLIVVGKGNLSMYFESLLQIFNQVLIQIISNPSNPKFNHFLFESVSFLVKYCCLNNPANYTVAENLLFPTLQIILRDDVAEYVPYLFQVLSLLLYLVPIQQLTSPESGFCQLLSQIMHPLLVYQLQYSIFS